MLIVDSQIHIWENEKMPGQHRQIPTYSKDDALAGMREAGVDAALIHPPSTLPKTVPTAIEAPHGSILTSSRYLDTLPWSGWRTAR